MVTYAQLEEVLFDILRDARKLREKGDTRKAHGMDEAAARIEALLPPTGQIER